MGLRETFDKRVLTISSSLIVYRTRDPSFISETPKHKHIFPQSSTASTLRQDGRQRVDIKENKCGCNGGGGPRMKSARRVFFFFFFFCNNVQFRLKVKIIFTLTRHGVYAVKHLMSLFYLCHYAIIYFLFRLPACPPARLLNRANI